MLSDSYALDGTHNMNKVIMMGRLTRDPEIRYSQGENSLAIARFSLAVDRRFKRPGEPDADFFNCTAFGKQAEFAEKYLKQGTKMVVVGRLQNDNYTNKEGQKVYSTQIMVDELEFAESKSTGGDSNGYQQTSRPTPSQAVGDGFMNIPDGLDEELPFN
jgi:single-strand DNA-binding protein